MTSPDSLRFGARTDKVLVETGREFAPKFDKDGLITAVTTDALTGEVLMVDGGYHAMGI